MPAKRKKAGSKTGPDRPYLRKGLRVLKRYLADHGWENLHGKTRTADGFQLGPWVVARRFEHRRGNLAKWLVAELEAIPGWVWSPIEQRHRRGLQLLRRYVKQHGWTDFTWNTAVEGFNLGAWIDGRRRAHEEGRLPDWLAAELEKIPGWTWKPTEHRQHHRVALLRKHVTRHGWENFTNKTVAGGVPLGTWVNNCRMAHKDGKLPVWLAKELEAVPGWSFTPMEDRQRRNVALLTKHVQRHGWNGVTQRTVVRGVKLGAWVSRCRTAHRKGRLRPWLKEALEAIPGWQWSLRRK